MAHGEADPGCADADSQPHTPDEAGRITPGRQIRRICAEPKAERVRRDRPDTDLTDDPSAEPPDPLAEPFADHVAESTAGPILFGRAPACRSERPGWAGAHRHGAVRPRRRATRKERPPDRWC